MSVHTIASFPGIPCSWLQLACSMQKLEARKTWNEATCTLSSQTYRSSDTMYIPRGIQVITVCELPHYKTKLKSTSLSTLAHCTKHQAGANRFVSVCRFCWYQCSHCENLVFLHLQKLPFFSPSAYSEKIRMAGVSFPRLLSLRIKCSICKTSLSTFQKKDFSEFFRVLPLSRCLPDICQKMQRCSACTAPA